MEEVASGSGSKERGAPTKEHRLSSGGIVQFGSSAVYHKLPLDHGDKKPTEVHRLVSRLEGDKEQPKEEDEGHGKVVASLRKVTTPPSSLSGIVRSGSVSEKLKMFGGGTQSPQKPDKPAAKKGDRAIRRSSLESRDTGVDQSDYDSPHPSSKEKQGSSFDAITEEDAGSGQPIKEEIVDKVSPLPRIHPGLARRQSQERLRLDGLPPPDSSERKSKTPRSPRGSPKAIRSSPPLARFLQQEMSGGGMAGGGGGGGRVHGSPSPNLRKKAISVYSPLVVSSNTEQPPGAKDASPSKDRPISAPSPQQGTKASALYMNSANLPHLNHLQERHRREMEERAEHAVGALLQEARSTGSKVPVEFQGAWLKERGKAYAWKQRVGVVT